MANLITKTLSLTTLPFLLTAIGCFLPFSASAATDFEICIKELTETGLSAENSAQACAKAFKPEELSDCVKRVNYYTAVNPENVVDNCFSVRRPEELAECVVDIRKETENTDPVAVIDYCRRSLLPKRFAQCVLSVHTQGNISANESLDLCIETKEKAVNNPERFPVTDYSS